MAKKEKSRQKKFDTRIDFTPMVDMNMLLITFFMLCTTMLKSEVLQIALPTNEKVEQEQQNKVKQSEAVTIIIDGSEKDGKSVGSLYYYDGMPPTAEQLKALAAGTFENPMKQVEFGNKEGTLPAIRGILQKRNEQVLKKVAQLNKDWTDHRPPFTSNDDQRNKEVFDSLVKKINKDSTLVRPVIIIKATPSASYAHVVSVLDEMEINGISRYQIDRINAVDSAMMILLQGQNTNK